MTSGQQANYTLVITPAGSSGTFSFACGTLPSNALCLFNPTSETLSAGVEGNVVVEISTGSGSTARLENRAWELRPRQTGPESIRFWRRRFLPCVAIGLRAPPASVRVRSVRRILLLVALLAIMTSGISSCLSAGFSNGSGGSGSCQSGGSGTPAGTYTIPVTVSSNGIAEQVDVTFTVD